MVSIEEQAKESLEARRAALLRSLKGSEGHRESRPPALLEGELAEIEAALQRIEEGQYGRCEACGAAIGRQLLRAVPEARRCLACT